MNHLKQQNGFSLVEIVIVVIVIAVIAALGYVAWNKFANQDEQMETSTSQPATADDVPTAPQIETTDDLDEASTTLDEIDLNGSGDDAQLEREVESFS